VGRKLARVRIIAGLHRGRSLVAPTGDATRPITDRAKQSLFDAISPLIEDAVVFDCFCGTGSMGLECLSRGARQAYFFDADRSALAGLAKNIAALKVADHSTVLAGDIFRLIRGNALPPAELIFFDPPYRFVPERPADLREFASYCGERLAHSRTELIFRHDAADVLELPPWTTGVAKSYGSMLIERLVLPGR
jgi:16S rRNA (guanine966-N2)-methyltransferase